MTAALFDKGEPNDLLLWLGVANSLTMDFVVRKKVRLKMSLSIMDSLPFPRDWRAAPRADSIIERVYALSTVGPEMQDFRSKASAMHRSLLGVTPVEDVEVRAKLSAEVEALVAGAIYDLTRDNMRYILDPGDILGDDCGVETFRVLRDRERRELGEYRTQRLVLEAWDRFFPALTKAN